MDNMKRIWDVVDDRRINMMMITDEASPHEIITVQPEYGSNNMVEDGAISFSFRRLRVMVLYKLPRVVSFSSACCTFSFPSLQKVVIVGCPDMKTFSAGNSLTPEGCDVQIQLKIAESDSNDDEYGIGHDKIDELINDDDQTDGFINDDDDEEEYSDNDTDAKHSLINTIVQNQSTAIATQREDGDGDKDEEDDDDEGSKGFDGSDEDADEGSKDLDDNGDAKRDDDDEGSKDLDDSNDVDEGSKDLDDNGDGDNEDDDRQLDLKTTIKDQHVLQME